MNLTRTFSALLVTHATAATVAWLNGWLVGRYLERRNHELDSSGLLPLVDEIRLSDVDETASAYDWTIDGECAGADR